jgi:hypothetical protein
MTFAEEADDCLPPRDGGRIDIGSAMRLLKAGLTYFALTFAAGFVLGMIRTLWVVPRFGARTAELLEMPLMLAVTILAARWTVRHLRVPPAVSARLAVGLIALGLLLTAEFTLVLGLRGLTMAQYLASRDPVSGTVYLVMLVLFGLMPLLVERE